MGRRKKTIATADGLDRRETAYYSTPSFVADFIATVVREINPEARTVFDPCVGRGEMVSSFLRNGEFAVEGVDILDLTRPPSLKFLQADFLKMFAAEKRQCVPGAAIDWPHDIYVANPPYNCHEASYVRANKGELNAAFGDVGVLNMYSMFVAALVDVAKDGALIGLITLDSFLTARWHRALRERIMRECALHYILLCPTDLFRSQAADVRTCILVMQKGAKRQGPVTTMNRPLSTAAFREALVKREFEARPLQELLLERDSDHNEIVVGLPAEVREMFSWPRLSELFPCITGISTGDDSRYLAGEPSERFSVPFYKNPGGRRFFTTPDAYLPWDFLDLDREISNFTVRNKRFLFQPGITCSSMGVAFSAAYLPSNAAFGVNAAIVPPAEDTWWLLGYLNSSLVTFFVRGVLNRSNMVTPGYVSRIPVPAISGAAKERLASIAREAYEKRVSPLEAVRYVSALDIALADELTLSEEISETIKEFLGDLVKRT